MDDLTGKLLVISGMTIQVIAEVSDSWKTRNVTTDEIVYFDKHALEQAIKLGKAEEVSDSDDRENAGN